jgi:hypothetical protein
MVQLILRRVNEASISVDVMPSTSFGEIKGMVEVRTWCSLPHFCERLVQWDMPMPVGFQSLHGIPKAAIRFIYAGKPVKDTETVASAGAAHETGAQILSKAGLFIYRQCSSLICAAIMMVVTRALIPSSVSPLSPSAPFPGGSSVVGGAAGGPSMPPASLPEPETFSLACKLLNGTTVSVKTSFSDKFSEIKKRLAVG